VFVPGRPLQPSLMFVVKASSLPFSGAPERCFNWVGSCSTPKNWTKSERNAIDKFSVTKKKSFATLATGVSYTIRQLVLD
jgi:hypothetical protein